MTAEDVLEVAQLLEKADIEFWLDGGWGIDALVGDQTRKHKDLDVAMAVSSVRPALDLLVSLGFRQDQSADPGPPARVVLIDASRQIDIHPLVFDAKGNGWQQLSASGNAWGLYPAKDLKARGAVAGHSVRCLSAALQFRFHLGYEWDEDGLHDIRLLTESLNGGPVPPVVS